MNANTHATYQRALHYDTNDQTLCGFVVSWDVKGIQVPNSDLATLLQVHRVPVTVKPIGERRALERALQAMAGDDIIRRTRNDESKSVYSVIKLLIDDRNELISGSLKMRITYYKTPQPGGKQLLFSSQEAENLLAPLIKGYQENHISADISVYVLLEMMHRRLQAIAIKQGGGTYFVPRIHVELLEQLDMFMKELGTRCKAETCRLTLMPIRNEPQAIEDLRPHAQNNIKARMQEIQSRLDELLIPERREKVRPQTVTRHIAEIQEVLEKADFYAAMLGIEMGDVTQQLAVLRQQFGAVIRGGATDFDFGPDPLARPATIAATPVTAAAATAAGDFHWE